MVRRLALLSLAVLLSACETNKVSLDYDASRDFAGYRSWTWKQPALQYRPDDPRIKSDLTEQRILDAVRGQLDQRGLREAQASSKGDLNIQTYLIVENRQQQYTSSYGGYGGYGMWGNYWGGPAYYETRTYDYKVATIQVDMLDAHDGRLVWRGSAEQVMNNYLAGPSERNTAIEQTVAKVLSKYPPKSSK